MKTSLCLVALVAAAALVRPAAAQPFPEEPKPGPSRPFATARPLVATLPNGLQVVVVERHALPLVSAVLLVRSGSELDPPDRAGLAAFTAGLLTEGVHAGDGGRAMSSPEIAASAEALGGSLSSSASWHGSSVSMTVTAPKLASALDLIQAVARRPAFAPDEIERSRAQSLDGLRVSLSQPGPIAARVAARTLFGTTPYGHSPAGTPRSIARLTRADLVAFHAHAYRPDNATLILAGDITLEQARALAQQRFGAWRKPAAAAPSDRAVATAAAQGAAVIVNLPGAGQAAGLVVLPSIARGADDYYTAVVANSVLGGGYSARLGTEVRIKRGLSYGAGSSLDARRLGGVESLSAQTKNPSAYELVDVMRSELARMSSEAVPVDELDARKASMIGAGGRAIETTAGLASQVAGLVIGGAPLDDIATWVQKVQAVTPAQIQDYAQRHWDADAATIVIVGDASQFPASGAPAGARRIDVDALDFDSPTLAPAPSRRTAGVRTAARSSTS